MRLHSLQYAVEVVGVDLDKFTILQRRERCLGLSSQIAEHTHDEWQFLEFDRVADLNVVSNMHARRPNAIQFVLRTFSSHSVYPRLAARRNRPPWGFKSTTRSERSDWSASLLYAFFYEHVMLRF